MMLTGVICVGEQYEDVAVVRSGGNPDGRYWAGWVKEAVQAYTERRNVDMGLCPLVKSCKASTCLGGIHSRGPILKAGKTLRCR